MDEGGQPAPICKCEPGFAFAPCISTLDIIGRLPEDAYRRLLANGQINAATTRREVEAIQRALQREADESRIRNLEPGWGRFPTLLIDPAWESEGGRGCPYATMRQEELLALPVAQWLEDKAHVYLCCTPREILNGNAVALFRNWGVQDNALLVWNKIWSSGRPALGMGQNFRHTVEFVLFGVVGDLRTRVALPTGFQAPVQRPHSTKPPELYEIIRRASYGPFGEVFQRDPMRASSVFIRKRQDG